MEDRLILVNEQDEQIGSCGKLEAHEKALLHRAFSVFIFRKVLVENPDGTRDFHIQLLVQKRAKDKYHSGGLWANSCCSHPRDGESLEEATLRRLQEETGIQNVKLQEAGAFIYRAEFENGLTEHEFDHVFVGWLDANANEQGAGDSKSREVSTCFEPLRIENMHAGASVTESWPGRNPAEAEEMKFVELDWLRKDVLLNAGKYAAWFVSALAIAMEATV